ncbi:MAG: NAD-dependent epimerase/dehydratase [Candidatus Solibacter sp.]|nr:NAD-dependent epimerase/dehydratase [Candidatus Solibacter sp.]
MKLTILAATGGIGRQVLQQAIEAGRDVTAVVRNPKKVSGRVRTIATNLAAPDPGLLQRAMEGADAVVSGLGPVSESEAGVTTIGTRAAIEAMKAAGVRRIVVVSAAPIGTVAVPGRPAPPKHDPGDGFFMRHLMNPMIRRVLKKTYADLALMEDLLRVSGLEWTIVRPPRLTDQALTGTYRTAIGRNLRGGVSISRADVAHLMLRVIAEADTIGRVMGVAY